jgi:hypothetical protein
MKRLIVCVLVAGGVLALVASTAVAASTKIVEPGGNPVHIKLDANGKPVAITVKATGFPPDSQVWVEQCNGRVPSDPNWAPTRDCDVGSSPAAAIADQSGTAVFAATDRNRTLQMFVGTGPENLFNCLTPKGASPNNGVADYRKCQIRVSSNNDAATPDQTFVPIVFGASSSGGSGSAVVLVVIGVVVVLLVGGFVIFSRRTRATATRR